MYFKITALFCFSVLRISSSVLRNYSPNLFHSVFLTIGSKFLGVSECSQQERQQNLLHNFCFWLDLNEANECGSNFIQYLASIDALYLLLYIMQSETNRGCGLRKSFLWPYRIIIKILPTNELLVILVSTTALIKEILIDREKNRRVIIAMARICRRKTEVLLVVEKIILEIIFMLSVVINRYRNTGQFRGFNVEYMRRYRMADRFPQQIEHMSELVEMSDTDCFDNLRLSREAFNRLCYLLRHMGASRW
ncbi:hypothetical protein ACS0TY_027722 [Phlomoides rotata]